MSKQDKKSKKGNPSTENLVLDGTPEERRKALLEFLQEIEEEYGPIEPYTEEELKELEETELYD